MCVYLCTYMYIHILMSLYRFLFIKSHEFSLITVLFCFVLADLRRFWDLVP